MTIQHARIVELRTQRREAARRSLSELRRLYLELGESARAAVRAQLSQLKRQEFEKFKGAAFADEWPWGRR